ncbi:hypothetical protein AB0G03_06535 [Micromonospora aurantiaca]|uniref:phage terminase small subunit n=1 Tax=Micromonospora aurantiaca (nom. illeg.) TaxID=47850 RepID=UPI0033DAC1B8
MALTTIPRDSGNSHRKPAFGPTFIVRRDGSLIGPELPESREWSEAARDWYEMWRRSDIAPLLEPTDWNHLQRTAILVELYCSGKARPSSMVALHAEIRRCEASYGATVLDRLKLRMQFVDSKEETPEVPAGFDYSDLLEEEEEDA